MKTGILLAILFSAYLSLPPALLAVAPPWRSLYRTRWDVIGTGRPIILTLDSGAHSGKLQVYRGRYLNEVREIEAPDIGTTTPRLIVIETTAGERVRVQLIGAIRVPR